MTTEKGKPMCDFQKTGVCAFHNVEIERREDYKKSTKEYVNNILGILIVVMIGSFTYTAISNSASETADSELRNMVRDLAVTVADLSETVAYEKGAVGPLVKQLERFNNNVERGKVRVITDEIQ